LTRSPREILARSELMRSARRECGLSGDAIVSPGYKRAIEEGARKLPGGDRPGDRAWYDDVRAVLDTAIPILLEEAAGEIEAALAPCKRKIRCAVLGVPGVRFEGARTFCQECGRLMHQLSGPV
jgi:hypothetical protein